jgi:hypothetical protein
MIQLQILTREGTAYYGIHFFGLSTLFWTLIVIPSKSKNGKRKIAKAHRLNYLSLLLTLFALFFFQRHPMGHGQRRIYRFFGWIGARRVVSVLAAVSYFRHSQA